MENSNSREYLEKIKAAVIDNLRQTGPAPSVQMQDVPRKPFGGMTDEEEAELDDMDEDKNKDQRMTEHRWDKHVENPAEFEDSDDDEMARANGATRPTDTKRTFTDYSKEGVNGAADDKPSPASNEKNKAGEAAPAEEAPDVNDDTIEDIGATERAEKEPTPQPADEHEAKKQKVDVDGDVGMEEPTAGGTAAIKLEETEPEAAAREATVEKTPEATAAGENSTAEAEQATSTEKPAEPTAEEAPSAETAKEKSAEPPVADAMDVDENEDQEKGKEADANKEKDASAEPKETA